MATLTQPVSIEEREPQTGGRGPDRAPPRNRDDEGGGFGFTEADRLRRYRVGMAVGLTPVLMLFVAFTSAYIVRQGLGGDWRSTALPPIFWVNTVILLASSVTMERARRRGALLGAHGGEEEGGFPWLGMTLILGIGFLTGQWMAWRQLAAQGVYISSNPSSSFLYLLTGSHGLHLAGGLVALVYASAASLLGRPASTRRIVVDITAWYWHFMDLLWIYILALLYFAR
ncbi:MAG: cytochrome c oxidase subunit 3 [Terriglobales bacterium]